MITKYPKKIFNFVKSFFKREIELGYPDKFAVIKFTEQAKKNGIYVDESKEIILFKFNEVTGRHDEFRVFNYNEEMISSLKDDIIPVLDTTQEIHKMMILKKIRPEIMTFEADA